jgi:hypothetical protein
LAKTRGQTGKDRDVRIKVVRQIWPRAKMYPTGTNGYEKDKTTYLFRQVEAAVAPEALR